MTAIEREIDERGWGDVLTEITTIAQRELETRPQIEFVPGCSISLVEDLKTATIAGREVDELRGSKSS